ncbi:hypothetical protein [Priestia megaterium]|uniref:hypothetical protein n=1 Tax=Priestia megaterium TaxID=1404 RepID=UPI0039F649A7
MSLREELLAKGYVEKTKPRDFVYFVDDGGRVVAKTCRQCGELKLSKEFHSKADGFGGLGPYCKPCISERDKDYYNKNRERLKQVKYAYYRRKRAEQLSLNLFDDNE